MSKSFKCLESHSQKPPPKKIRMKPHFGFPPKKRTKESLEKIPTCSRLKLSPSIKRSVAVSTSPSCHPKCSLFRWIETTMRPRKSSSASSRPPKKKICGGDTETVVSFGVVWGRHQRWSTINLVNCSTSQWLR